MAAMSEAYLAHHIECLRAVAKYHRDKQAIPLEDFVESLRASYQEFNDIKWSYKEAKELALRFFEATAGAGFGTYKLGRRGRPTRLVWRKGKLEALFEQATAQDAEVREILDGSREGSGAGAVDAPAASTPLTRADIAADVRRVLQRASKGKGSRPQWLTAYQILDRLPQRELLVDERGMPGKDAGAHQAAASVVADAIRYELKDEVEVTYFDNVGVLFEIDGVPVRAGFPVCGIYRIADEAGVGV